MITFTYSAGIERPPGTYKLLRYGDRLSATVICPLCAQKAVLLKHTIDGDGRVNPSLVCPYAGCTFHDYAKLDGWPLHFKEQ